jgi:hypothetical protein
MKIIVFLFVLEVRACTHIEGTHIEGTCQEKKRSYTKKVVLVFIASSYRHPLPTPFFLYFNVSVLHCTIHPSGLRSCPQHIHQAEPFPLICGPENLRSRVGSNFYISDRMVVNQPTVAPDADSKDADNSYVTGGNGLPIRCLVFAS